jgi:hypothetical protein
MRGSQLTIANWERELQGPSDTKNEILRLQLELIRRRQMRPPLQGFG